MGRCSGLAAEVSFKIRAAVGEYRKSSSTYKITAVASLSIVSMVWRFKVDDCRIILQFCFCTFRLLRHNTSGSPSTFGLEGEPRCSHATRMQHLEQRMSCGTRECGKIGRNKCLAEKYPKKFWTLFFCICFFHFHLVVDISDASRPMKFEGTDIRCPVSDATISAVEVLR